jgi:diguanylate cyclase (GGDEF)-like protein/putative nucleotidyltransferase with HDIG domain
VKLLDMSDYDRPGKVYWAVMVVAGTLTGAWALYQCLSFNSIEWAKFLTLLALVIVAGAFPIRMPGTATAITAGSTFTFLGAIFLGVPAAIMLSIADSLTSGKSAPRRLTSWICAASMLASTTFIAASLFYFSLPEYGGNYLSRPHGASLSFDHVLLPLLVMTFCQYVLNGLSIAALSALRTGNSIWAYWRDGYLWTSWTFIGGAVAAAIMYGAIGRYGFLDAVAGVPVIYAAYAVYKLYFESLAEKTSAAAELSDLHLSTVEALATAIDAKDQTSHCHVRRVQIYAAGMGRVFGLSAKEIEALKAGALLHDIGKLAVPDHILNKPGRLTTAEFDRMKIHTEVGAEILSRVNFPYPVLPVVRHHHEQWNGQGYPDGLHGEEIPLTARILSVVDCFDSVREDRPYRRGMTRDEARALLLRGAGTHFDPKVVELFLKHLPRFEQEITLLGLMHQESREDEHAPRTLSEVNAKRALTPSIAYDQIKNANREIFALYEIARTFGSSLDIEDTMSILVNKVGHIIPFDTCVVYLYDELKAYAVAAHVAGKNAESLKNRCVAPGEGVTGFALANRRHITRIDPSLDFAGVELPEGFEYRSMVSLPLLKEERLLGALSVYSAELSEYSDEHIRLLETVTRLASDALSNALNHAEAESNALTDPLTGLPNARYMYLRFDQEAARARRTAKPFLVVMLDLDDFKQVNDTFGHKIGDKMLREVARLLQAQLREYDFLARYAGDEFVAIVQDLAGGQVEELRERVEATIKGFSLHVRTGHYARVGISMGASTFGIDGETLDQLLIAADQAMYNAKSEHKRVKAESGDVLEVVDMTTGKLASAAIN